MTILIGSEAESDYVERTDPCASESTRADSDGIIQISFNDYYDGDDKDMNNQGQVVWCGGVPNRQIWLWDNGTTTQITDDPWDHYTPKINNNGHIVWVDWPVDADSNIGYWDGTTARIISTGGGGYSDPQINDNDNVVWTWKKEPGDTTLNEICYWDGSDVVQLTNNSYNDVNPRINDNNWVVWEGQPVLYNVDIFLWNGTDVITLVSSPDEDFRPMINSNNQIVYQSGGIKLWDGGATIDIDDAGTEPVINDNGEVAYIVNSYIMLWDGSNSAQISFPTGYTNSSIRDCWQRINNKGNVVWQRDTVGILYWDGTGEHLIRGDYGSQPCLNDNLEIVWAAYDETDQEMWYYNASSVPATTQPLMTMEKTCRPPLASPGDIVEYWIEYRNRGNGIAGNVTITESYPDGITFSSAVPPPTSGDDVWMMGDVYPGDWGRIIISMSVQGIAGGLMTNIASLEYDNSAGEPQTPVTGTADLTLEAAGTEIIAQWHFDEGVGQTAYDSSGNGNDGILGSTDSADSSDPTWTSGVIGGGLRFDGIDDYVNLGGLIDDYLAATYEYTFEMWFKPDVIEAAGLLGNYNNASDGSFQFQLTGEPGLDEKTWAEDGEMEGGWSRDGAITTTSWSHLALTRSGYARTFVLNGNVRHVNGYGFNTDVLRGSVANTYAGCSGNPLGSESHFSGIIDEVIIWGRALTYEDIESDYRQVYSEFNATSLTDVDLDVQDAYADENISMTIIIRENITMDGTLNRSGFVLGIAMNGESLNEKTLEKGAFHLVFCLPDLGGGGGILEIVLVDSVSGEMKVLKSVALPGTEGTAIPWMLIVFGSVIGTSAALAIATEVGKYSLLLALMPLYTKLKKEDVLEMFTRGKINGYIIANPGEHYNAIKRALDLNNGSLAYHLSVLEKEGVIKSRSNGHYKRFYPIDHYVPNGGTLTPSQDFIISTVGENPGISLKGIASVMGISSSTANYHMQRLIALDIILEKRNGMRKGYWLNPTTGEDNDNAPEEKA